MPARMRTDVATASIAGELVAEPNDIGAGKRLGGVLTAVRLPSVHCCAGLRAASKRSARADVRTNTPARCRPHGPMVVSMRPMTPAQAIRATQICTRFSRAHGTPIHLGDPAAIGIRDIARPDFGDPVPIRAGEIPVFWACGVTPQAVVMQAKPPICVTHKPGHMFVTDWKDVDLRASGRGRGQSVSYQLRASSSCHLATDDSPLTTHH